MTNHHSENSRYSSADRPSSDKSSAGKKGTAIVVSALLIAGVAAAGLYLVDFDQTKEARLPNVDVKVTDGQMPAFDVDVADVSVEDKALGINVPTVGVQTETKTIEIEVPVDVYADMKEETVVVPTLNIERPEADNPADNPSD